MTGDDRAVSEVLSFALVFSIIVTSVALTFVLGFPALEDERDAERVTNAERAYDILADNMADVYKRGAPSRATELKLSNAQLVLADEETVNVTVVNGSGTTVGAAPVSYRPIVYQTDSAVIAYENGAIVRADESGGAVMKRDPEMLFTEERVVVPYVETRSRSVQSVGSDSTVLVRGVESGREVLFERRGDPPYTVTLNVSTPEKRAVAWERYLESELDWETDPCTVHGGTTVSCEFTTDQVYVSVTRIDVDFE